MLVLLDINSISIDVENAELVALGFGLAEGSIDAASVERWIINHTVA